MSRNHVTQEGALTQDRRSEINKALGDYSRCTTEFDVDSGTTGSTLANVVGMVTDTLTPGTYHFYIHLAMTSTANGGLKAGLKFGTASMLTSIESTARLFTALNDYVVGHSTTATDAASLVASTTAITNAVIEGVLVVAASGTLQLQAAQNAAHADNTTIYVNSFMKFVKIA
jgi:hypothetical protein